MCAQYSIMKLDQKSKVKRHHGVCSCELSLVPAHFKVARGRPKVKSVTAFALKHHLLVRTLPRASALQGCAGDQKSKA
jgi:hypothetical protein